ncbi:MAG: DUF6774 domain-containing protein [Hungatella sp.]
MDSCELTVLISTLACRIADGKSPEEIALLSSIFMQLGDSLTTMVDIRFSVLPGIKCPGSLLVSCQLAYTVLEMAAKK